MKEKIKNFLIKILESKAIIKIGIVVSFILIIYVISNLTYWVNSSKYKSVDINNYKEEIHELSKDNEVEVKSAKSLIAENDNYIMYVNTKTTNVTIESKTSSNTWSTMPNLSGVTTYGDEKNIAQSAVVLEYEVVANLKQYYQLNSYTDCVSVYTEASPTYHIYKIDNGIRIDYKIEKSDITMNYFPVKLTYERMNELLLEREDDLVDTKLEKLITKQMYEDDKTLGCWVRKDSAPVSSRKMLYDLLYNKILYTFDDLTADNLVFEVETNVPLLPSFNISIEYILKDDYLDVNVPTYAWTENETYRIKDVTILPYFGASLLTDDGYIFVPDGSGALMEYNNYTPSSYCYTKKAYNNGLLTADGYAYSTSKSSSVDMPVMGSINTTNNTGIMMIINNGQEMSTLYASSSGYMNNQYNIFYTNISYLTQDSIGLYNTYDTNKVIIEDDKVIFYNYNLFYYFLENENASYYKMAETYRNYLIEKYDLTSNFNDSVMLNLEVIGGVTVTRKIFGFSYLKEIPLTTTADILTIEEELENNGIYNTNYIYSGWSNYGLNQSSTINIKVLKSIKKEVGITELISTLNSKGANIEFSTNLINIYKAKENGFNKNKYASRTLDNQALKVQRYSKMDYSFKESSEGHYYLSPKYLNNSHSILLKNYQKLGINSICYNDLGNNSAADYNRNSIISALSGRKMIDESLKNNSLDYQVFKDPFDYSIKYASYLTDVDYDSSNLYCFTETIPFKELVYNGLISFSTTNINNNTIDFNQVELLKSLETGADLKFLITYRNSEELKETDYNYIYASDYTNWKEDIISLYKAYEEFYRIVGSKEIISHERLDNNVYKVTYKGGKQVIFNYSYLDYTYGTYNVPVNSYVVL